MGAGMCCIRCRREVGQGKDINGFGNKCAHLGPKVPGKPFGVTDISLNTGLPERNVTQALQERGEDYGAEKAKGQDGKILKKSSWALDEKGLRKFKRDFGQGVEKDGLHPTTEARQAAFALLAECRNANAKKEVDRIIARDEKLARKAVEAPTADEFFAMNKDQQFAAAKAERLELSRAANDRSYKPNLIQFKSKAVGFENNAALQAIMSARAAVSMAFGRNDILGKNEAGKVVMGLAKAWQRTIKREVESMALPSQRKAAILGDLEGQTMEAVYSSLVGIKIGGKLKKTSLANDIKEARYEDLGFHRRLSAVFDDLISSKAQGGGSDMLAHSLGDNDVYALDYSAEDE